MVGTFMTDPSGDGSVSAPFKALGVRAYKWGRLGEGRGRACTETPVRKLKSQTETQRGGIAIRGRRETWTQIQHSCLPPQGRFQQTPQTKHKLRTGLQNCQFCACEGSDEGKTPTFKIPSQGTYVFCLLGFCPVFFLFTKGSCCYCSL